MSSNTCANCGKEGNDVTNTCNKCKEVMYCNAACKKKHRTKHKKQCERRVRELHDEALFKQPPRLEEDCPICFLRMPSITQVQVYMSCCGKIICGGCIHAVKSGDVDQLCPFCRTPAPFTDAEIIERYEKRMDMNNDPISIYNIGNFYFKGNGLPQNQAKGLELWHRAAKLGHNGSYCNIGNVYNLGVYVERDIKKAIHYWELAATSGDVRARCNLGFVEKQAGNVDRALKHWMIAVEGGCKMSLDGIKEFYLNGHATKDDYTKALRLYQAYLDDIKSVQRDAAAAVDGRWQYYE